ncbi:MAG: S8 family serine peptidase, partial [Desulfomonilia bacterium]|nr:S8 family serine peptidase [Desulfomonilia bacterium]
MSRKHTHISVLTLLMVGLVFVFFHLTGCSSSDHDHSGNQGQDSTRLMSFSAADFTYYSGGEQNDLAVFTERIAVGVADENLDHLTAWLQNDPLVLQPPEIEELGRKNLVLVSLIEGATEEQIIELIERLNASGLVKYATPVFGTEEEMTLITDAFVVRFLDTYSVGEIEAYIASQGATIVERDFLWPKCYRLSFTSQSGANVLEMAGTFYESGMVIFAHPDFITYTEPPWQPLMEEDFETGFPEDVEVYDDNPADGQYFWGRVSSVEYPSLIDDYTEGSYKCWVAASHDPASPDRSPGDVADETYAPNMDAWMIFGPYDLSGSYWSQLTFIYEIDSPPKIQEEDYPTISPEKGFLVFRVSVDGQNWTGAARSLSGIERNSYYIRQEFFRDMFGLVNIDEADHVWFALQFISDEDPTGIADEEHEQLSGVFVDDIRLLVSNTEPAPAITTDPFSCRQWALHNVGQSGGEAGWDINILPAWDLIDTIPDIPAIEDSIIVAVIDEGIDLDHEDLNLVAGYDATYDPDDPERVDSHGGPNPWDGHGTACAGIIGAKNNDTGIVGVAPGVKIMPVRIAFSKKGSSRWTTSDSEIADGILWAANNGAKVLSNSWGGGPDSDIEHNAIRDAKDMGCTLVFCSHNWDSSAVTYPARYPETIAVGAMSPCGERKSGTSCDGESWGSNYGPNLDVVAPGVMIPTCDISEDGGYAVNDDFGHSADYFMSFNGTSSATPHVAGIA